MNKVKPRWRPMTSNSSEGRKQLALIPLYPQLIPEFFLTDCTDNQVVIVIINQVIIVIILIDLMIRNFGKLLAKIAEIE
jgi:hypothetical protein